VPRPRASLLVSVALVGGGLAVAPAHAASEVPRRVPLVRPSHPALAVPPTTAGSTLDVLVPLTVPGAASRAVTALAHSTVPVDARRARLRGLQPSATQSRRVQAWAVAQGFTVTATTPWSVGVRGRAGELARAFGASLKTTTVQGKRFVTPRTAPRVPVTLAGLAEPVIGLDTRPIWSGHAAYGGGDVQVLNRSPVRGSTAGQGTTVATVNLSGWHASDLTTYRAAAFGSAAAAPAVTSVVVGKGHVTATVLEDDYGLETEVALDAEAIAGVAPAAKQRMYFGGNSSADYVAILQRMTADLLDGDPGNDFQTASTSWGACELAVGQAELDAMRSAISTMTAAGATFFAASGDDGAFGCGDGQTAAVDFPAAAEDAVAVGGTTVTGQAPGYSSSGWDGSGGGCSTRVVGLYRQVAAGSPCSGRAVPDLATLADPGSGFWVFDRVDQWVPVGGTSLAAPASAAGLAVVMAHLGVSALDGAMIDVAYANPSAFDDVTSGQNGLYRARTGYDLVTGLGSPRWTALEAALSPVNDAEPTPTGYNEPLLAVDPTYDPDVAYLDTVMPDGTSTEPAIVPNGEPVTGYAVSGTATTSCASTFPGPPSTALLPGTQGVVQLSVSVATSGSPSCITVQRPVVVDSQLPAVPSVAVAYAGTTSPAYRFSWGAASDAAPSSGTLMYVARVHDSTTGSDAAVFATTGRAFPYAGSPAFKAVAGHSYSVRVTAVDGAWNTGQRTVTTVAPYDDTKVSLSKHLASGSYVSDWARSKASPDYLGSHVRSSRKGASFSYRFTAKTVTLGVVKSPYGGYADVYLDGVRKTRISLYASGTRYRQQVRVISLATRGTHTVKVVVTGLHPSGSKGNLVYLDSLTLA
jgi:hypothetical protein